jgi:zinc transport system substrate-binding protein
MRTETPAEDRTLNVTASFYPMAYLAERVGGEHARVTNLTPAGAEPHDFEPSARDIARIEDADVLILNGAVEAWGDRVIAQLQGRTIRIITAGSGLLSIEANEEQDDHAGLDPHVWLDPLLYKQEAMKIADIFAEADPEHADAYAANVAVLGQELDALDAEYQSALSDCRTRDIVTTHTAFAYLAQRYGLHQMAIAGLSPEGEPSPAELASVAEFARANGVHYIFFETLVSPRLAETVASEIGAQTLVLDPIEGLSTESMAAGQDYFSVMRENLANLRIALECKA